MTGTAVTTPPVSSTGVQMTGDEAGRLGIGWAQGTTHATSCADVRAWLGEIFGPATLRKSGLQWYERAWSLGEAGVVVADLPRSSSSHPGEVYIVIPQGAFDALGWAGSVRVLALLSALGVRLSRVDVYFDDLRRLADPSDVIAAVEAGNVRSRVKSWRVVRDSAGGMTAYLGSRTGECMVRVYRKWAESGVESDGVRWEMEAKGARAPLVADLVRGSSSPAVVYFELLRAFCDFVERRTLGSTEVDPTGARIDAARLRGDRAALLPWWSLLVGTAGRARLVGVVVVDTLVRKVAWLRRQVAPTLALVFGVHGSGVVSDLIDEGWERARWELAPVRA
jgi:DNA relaxase NicK